MCFIPGPDVGTGMANSMLPSFPENLFESRETEGETVTEIGLASVGLPPKCPQ